MPGVISTNPARCRDCYCCVRTCPVKAVRVSGGQAEVVADLCIACASCVRACPQRAKVVRDDLPLVKAALASGRTVIASVAPSAPAYFNMPVFAAMEGALAALAPIPDPANYLLRLDDDGTFIARADCKSVAGTYSLSGSDLTLELTPPPKHVCGKDSRADQYVALLRRVATYDLPEKSSLALGLKEGAGYLYFYAPAQ
jgi:NAD-dependent dihydropyrimidine dehydrogenase PreA subunit